MVEHVNRSSERRGGSSRTKKVIVTVVIIVICIIAILLLLNRCNGESDPEPTPSAPGGGVTIGTIKPGTTDTGDKDIQTLLNEQVADGMFRVFIATHISVDTEGNMQPLIQNAGRNRYHCWVEIVDENDNSVYATDVIPPGYKVETDTMEPLASRGINKCRAVFHLLQGSTKDSGEVNRVEVAVDLVQE